jgi:hypothetical protein
MAFDKKGPHAGKFSAKCKPVDAPDFLVCVDLLKSIMTVVKSVSDGLRD